MIFTVPSKSNHSMILQYNLMNLLATSLINALSSFPNHCRVFPYCCSLPICSSDDKFHNSCIYIIGFQQGKIKNKNTFPWIIAIFLPNKRLGLLNLSNCKYKENDGLSYWLFSHCTLVWVSTWLKHLSLLTRCLCFPFFHYHGAQYPPCHVSHLPKKGRVL